MGPKRKDDEGLPKMIVFGRSRISAGDVDELRKNNLVVSASAPGKEVIPKPEADEVVIF